MGIGSIDAGAQGAAGDSQITLGSVLDLCDAKDSQSVQARLRQASVLLVGSPISAGLAAFQEGGSIASALQRWTAQADLIEASASESAPIMLAEAALATPDAYAEAIFKLTGARLSPRVVAPSPQPDLALTQAILAVVAGDSALRRLYQLLRARAKPLAPGDHAVAEWPALHARYPLSATYLDAFAETLRRESELTRKLEQLNAERAAASVSPELQAELEEAKRGGDLLLIQLHQVQEELEHYYLQWREAETALEQAKKHRAPAFPGDARISGLSLGEARTDGPYSSLDAVLAEASSGGREWRNLPIRLVEHHGAPGLAVFADPATAPLSVWQPHGSEAGRPFMLLVPSDTGFSALWQAFPTAEWQLLLGILEHLEATLREGAREDHVRWLQVAQRLRLQMYELPPRFRYDQLRVEATSQDQLVIHFDNVLFGRRRFEGISLEWLPASADVRLPAFSRDGLPILSRRPADNKAAEGWKAPVSSDTSVAQRMAAWNRISHGDQQWVLALLDALPAALPRLAAANIRLKHTGEALERLARLPLRQAQQDLGGGRLRAILSRFLFRSGPVRA